MFYNYNAAPPQVNFSAVTPVDRFYREIEMTNHPLHQHLPPHHLPSFSSHLFSSSFHLCPFYLSWISCSSYLQSRYRQKDEEKDLLLLLLLHLITHPTNCYTNWKVRVPSEKNNSEQDLVRFQVFRKRDSSIYDIHTKGGGVDRKRIGTGVDGVNV